MQANSQRARSSLAPGRRAPEVRDVTLVGESTDTLESTHINSRYRRCRM
jgi:hypothetical protein